MHPLTLAGQAVEAVGLVATIVGLHRTWQEFGDPDVSLWEPVSTRLRVLAESLWRRARAVWARLLRRRQNVVVNVGVAAIQLTGSMSARARVTWGPLPKGKTADQLREIDRRIQAMSNQIADLAERHDDALEEIRKTHADGLAGLERAISDLEGETRHLAVGGIRLQLVGVGLLVVGLALQLLGTILSL
jgi:hypothetical protein